MSNKELSEELHKAIIRKSKKRKVYSPCTYNDQSADMLLLSKFNKVFLLCIVDIFNKYAWVIPLQNKKDNYNY